MTSWEIARVAARVRRMAMEGRVRFTLKAIQELSTLGLDSSDAIEVLAGLRASTFFERFASRESDEWLYVFKPDIDGMVMYLKLVLRTGCVIVSFHEDGSDEEEDEST